jgi:prepilin-type N-terminal cleavage/methylation domain-containing protein
MKRNGFTVIELMTAITLGCIVMIPVAMLVQSGQKSWNSSYNTANCQSQLDSIGSITSFCSFGRESNKKDYYVYSTAGSGSSTTYTKVTPVANPEEILTGQAVEFRYWSTGLTAAMLSPTSVTDSYAFFYVDSNQLKVDFFTSTNGTIAKAIDTAKHRITAGVNTVILASNVTSVAFTHTTKDMAGDGYGSVCMKLIINSPADGQSKTFLAATCLRNVWPE